MVPQKMRRWGCFLSSWLCREKEGGILAAHTGQDPSSVPASLGGPRTLHGPGSAAGQAPFGSCPSAWSCVHWLDLGVGGGCLYLYPHCLTPPEVLLRGPRGRIKQRAISRPPALPACFDFARGSLALGNVWYPRKKTARSPR